MKHWNTRLKAGAVIVAFFLVLGFIVPLFCPRAVVPSRWPFPGFRFLG